MADQEQSTEQPLSQVSEVFRESFIVLFERPDHEAALRVVAEVVQDVVFEGRNALLTAQSRRETNIRRSCRGAVGDLRQAANRLAEVARGIDEVGTERETVRMVLAVADAVAAVEPIAARLEAALLAYVIGSGSADSP
jgi:hypothetical protein